ncbi:MAG: TonB-dependent receptor [Blastocatellia bacterium]|nr:TonB-dependent receptor [Blastocatellia bacterium]MBL8193262.1 TonB-dependent receptor [Blastocatellia bacterium]MBN8722110.1 TonB-dependent receptor [Acidobacteriota bacterium]
MKKRYLVFFYSLFLCLIFFQVTTKDIFAQSRATGADLIGVIKDQSGGVISAANIVVRNPETNFERTITANEDGTYQFLALRPGTYELIVSAPGFADYKQLFNLVLGSIGSLDVTMNIAGESNVVVVTGTKIVETTKSAVTQTVDSNRIDNLPINGRNFLGFAFINALIGRDNTPPLGPAPTTGLNFAGQRARSNLVQVDGADNIDNGSKGARSTISQEAVQEFQVVINSFAAEYGRTAGGVVNIVTKSGTNEFHGNAFGFLRQRAIQARNALAFPPVGANPKPAFTRGQYGFTFGGPIKRDKTFFFLSLDQTRRRESGFSDIGRDSTLFDLTPAQQAFIANNPSVGNLYAMFARSGASVAQTGIDPTTGAAVFLPTFLASNGQLGAIPGIFRTFTTAQNVYPIKDDFTFYSAKVDQQINLNNRLSARYNFTPITTTGIQSSGQNQPFGLNDVSRTGVASIRDTAAVAQLTSILDNTKINEFIFNFGRRSAIFSSSANVAINIPGAAFFGREPFSPASRQERVYEIKDNFSYIIGQHTTKFGASVNFVRTSPFMFELNFSGVFNFGDLAATSVSPMFAGAPSFTAVQAYGLGLPQTFIQGFGNSSIEVNNTQFGFYGQDSWKIRPNLILNYGVRYDFELTPSFPATGISTDRLTLSAEQVDAAERFLNVMQGIPRDRNNIAPRIAIAYDPRGNGKTVIRAAYGLFYDNPLLFIAGNSVFANGVTSPQLIAPGGSPLPNNSLNAAQIFQGTLLPATPGIDRGARFLSGQSRFDPKAAFVGYGALLPFTLPVDRDFQFAYTNQVNLTIEHELFSDTALQVTYLFTGGRKLPHSVNRNAPDGRRVLTASATDRVINNFFRPSGPNPVFVKTDRPIPFGTVGVQEATSSSVYHGVSFNVTKRFSGNLQLQASYSYSKTIDDSTDLQSLLQPQDNRRPGLERSLSLFDQRHRFVISGVLKSPFKQNSAGFRKLLADTTFSPIIELSSGRPFNILTGTDTNLDQSSVTDRPNVDITTGMLSIPGPAEIGSLGRNVGISPGFASVDMRLSRSISLGENLKLELISEVFNLFNRVNVSTVNNNFRVVTFDEGRFKSPPTALFDPRQFQFSLKIKF